MSFPVQRMMPIQNGNDVRDALGRFASASGMSADEHKELEDRVKGLGTSLSRPMTILGTDLPHHEVSKYLEKNGKEWEAAPLPSDIKMGTPKECYSNATHLILRHPELSYCEGIAYPGDLPSSLGFLHAWAVDKDGKVVDPTFREPEKAKYFGVKYDNDKYLKHIQKTETYGVLGGSDKSAEKVLKKGGI